MGHSKDHRDDLPQVVIGEGRRPVRCWTFPGDTSDQAIIRRVKDDLAAWNLHRLVRVIEGSPPREPRLTAAQDNHRGRRNPAAELS